MILIYLRFYRILIQAKVHFSREFLRQQKRVPEAARGWEQRWCSCPEVNVWFVSSRKPWARCAEANHRIPGDTGMFPSTAHSVF